MVLYSHCGHCGSEGVDVKKKDMMVEVGGQGRRVSSKVPFKWQPNATLYLKLSPGSGCREQLLARLIFNSASEIGS